MPTPQQQPNRGRSRPATTVADALAERNAALNAGGDPGEMGYYASGPPPRSRSNSRPRGAGRSVSFSDDNDYHDHASTSSVGDVEWADEDEEDGSERELERSPPSSMASSANGSVPSRRGRQSSSASVDWQPVRVEGLTGSVYGSRGVLGGDRGRSQSTVSDSADSVSVASSSDASSKKGGRRSRWRCEWS